MRFNWDIIGDKIFGILKGAGFSLQMFNEQGNKTMDPHDANRFFASIKSNNPKLESISILIGLHDENADSHLDIKTPDLENDDDFDMILRLKKSLKTNIGDREGLKINWYKFDHEIRAKDDAYNNIKESRDVGKIYGTTKSSFQRIGESKLIIRHTDPVDESKQGSRWRKIKGIFIETRAGERFMYPHAHISGAKAMARHLSKGGKFNDDIANKIIQTSEDYIQLKKARKLLRNCDQQYYDSLRECIRRMDKFAKRLSKVHGYDSAISDLSIPIVDNVLLHEYRDMFIEKCGCTLEDIECRAAMTTAARYLFDTQQADEAVYSDIYREADLARLQELADVRITS